VLLASCGAAVRPASGGGVAFTDVASAGMSAYEGAATVVVGASDASRARIVQLVGAASSVSTDRVLVAAFQGSQRTGGYAIRIDRIERDGDQLVLRATFTEPQPNGVVIQVLTSPAHVVSVARTDVAHVASVVLRDADGKERARARVG